MKSFMFALLALLAQSGHAVTIDFEEFSTSGSERYSALTSQGFDLIAEHPSHPGSEMFIYESTNGTNALALCPECTVTIQRVNLQTFSASSVDLANTGASVEITGYYAGGGTVSQTFINPDSDFYTVSLVGAWQNLERIVIGESGGVGQGIDNIVVTPIPAAVSLFASSLGVLGWLRRRRVH